MVNTIKTAIKESMKAKMPANTKVLRAIVADANNLALLDKRKELTDEDVLSALTRGLKQRQDSYETYMDAGRDDLADVEAYEIDVIKEFLPKQLTAGEVEAIIREAINSTGATTKKDMGRVMGVVMPKTKGRYDGKLISKMVAGLLG